MKKSHRKDVIAARIVFAVFCLLLIAAITGAVLVIRGRLAEQKSTQESQSQQKEPTQSGEPVDAQPNEPAVTPEPSQTPEPNPIMRTTTGVNMREEPNTSCEVITVLEEGTMLEMLGEESGWAFVDCQGQTGYVSLDYLEEVTAQQ